MVEIREFDIKLLEDFIYDGVDVKVSGTYVNKIIEYYASLGDAYIGIVDNKIIGVGGIYPLWEDFGGAWLFLNKEAVRYKVSVFKSIFENINNLIKKYQIKTLIVNCADDILQARTLITHLGFLKIQDIKMGLYFKSGE